MKSFQIYSFVGGFLIKIIHNNRDLLSIKAEFQEL